MRLFIFAFFLLLSSRASFAFDAHGCQIGTDCVAASDMVSRLVAPGDPITCLVRLQHTDAGTPLPGDTVTPTTARILVHHADGDEDSGELVLGPAVALNNGDFKDFFFETVAHAADTNTTLFATGLISGSLSSGAGNCGGSFPMSIDVDSPSITCPSAAAVLLSRCSSCTDAIILGTLTRVCRTCSAPLP